jgi:hypothetical protein
VRTSSDPSSDARYLADLMRGDAAAWARLDRDPAGTIRAADRHGVTALVAETRESVPEPLGRRVRDLLAADLVRERALQRALARVAAGGVRALLMKGVDLAYSVYPRPDLRPRVDTDLLVAPEDRPAVTALLEQEGYCRVVQSGGDLVMYQEAFSIAVVPGVTHVIDLHWRITNPQRFGESLAFGELYAASVPRPSLGPSARGLSPVHALALACVHRIAHHYDAPRLIWLYDIHLLASALDETEWREWAALVRQRRVVSAARRGLTLAGQFWSSPVPADVLAALAAGDREGDDDAFENPGSPHAARVWSDLRRQPDWSSRWRLASQHLFPTLSYMRTVYAPSSTAPWPWLYVRRLVSGARRWLHRRPS